TVSNILCDGIFRNKSDVHDDKFLLFDIGAGTGFWSRKILQRSPGIKVIAVEPSRKMLSMKTENTPGLLHYINMTAQELAEQADGALAEYQGKADCIMFMQSAHYIHADEFQSVMEKLTPLLKPEGHFFFQARNMNRDWWPWPVPGSWKNNIQMSLRPLYMLADRYERQLNAMNELKVDGKWTEEIVISVPLEEYLERLRKRWIPSIMHERAIDGTLLEKGIAEMEAEYRRKNLDAVTWMDRFTMVSAKMTKAESI
ncbi:class I SAM-dependent methyltransferase, partial [Pantoea agglomerans]|uniref:class I SAM-dependent methyltransferase n=1 Tax=Enterobacter agglomerans TaxID=549 RepID=UPI001877DD89